MMHDTHIRLSIPITIGWPTDARGRRITQLCGLETNLDLAHSAETAEQYEKRVVDHLAYRIAKLQERVAELEAECKHWRALPDWQEKRAVRDARVSLTIDRHAPTDGLCDYQDAVHFEGKPYLSVAVHSPYCDNHQALAYFILPLEDALLSLSASTNQEAQSIPGKCWFYVPPDPEPYVPGSPTEVGDEE